MTVRPLVFDFEIVNKTGQDWNENSLLAAYVNLYMDYKSYTANKITWMEVRESVARAEEFMASLGVEVKITNDDKDD